ncbi:MAG: hypothetical protein JWM11_192 [Planctomycetaceae bacterium]|nr:hypothetical protein [Planctomycetaceae bacterium]
MRLSPKRHFKPARIAKASRTSYAILKDLMHFYKLNVSEFRPFSLKKALERRTIARLQKLVSIFAIVVGDFSLMDNHMYSLWRLDLKERTPGLEQRVCPAGRDCAR